MRFPGDSSRKGWGMAARWLYAQCPAPGSRAVRAMWPSVLSGAPGRGPGPVTDNAGRRWAARVDW